MKDNFWEKDNNKNLEKLLENTKDLALYKRIQCVYLRINNKLSAEKIAATLGWHIAHVWKIHSYYKRLGDKMFVIKNKGGRYHANMAISEEQQIIKSLEQNANAGSIVEISKIKALYEETLGRKVHKTVIYRMLKRHNWRKIVPRKIHPQNKKESIEDFKKTLNL
jgi:transposase